MPAEVEIAVSDTFESEDELSEAVIEEESETEAIGLEEKPEETEAITEQITFEVPEIEEETTEQEISIAPIKEEPVDNLDKLMFTEMIALDYTAYAGLSFEPGARVAPVVESKEAEQESEPEQDATEEPIIAEEDGQPWEESLGATEPEAEAQTTALPEFDLENKYYTIGEVAQMFGVNVSHIRFWTTEFSLKVRTTRKGDRLYNPENIGKLRLIHHLVKENKHTIKGAKEQLKARKQAINAQVDLKDKLSSLKAQLERIKRNL
jgi:DNA-binding transcriptional MerR regulator